MINTTLKTNGIQFKYVNSIIGIINIIPVDWPDKFPVAIEPAIPTIKLIIN